MLGRNHEKENGRDCANHLYLRTIYICEPFIFANGSTCTSMLLAMRIYFRKLITRTKPTFLVQTLEAFGVKALFEWSLSSS